MNKIIIKRREESEYDDFYNEVEEIIREIIASIVKLDIEVDRMDRLFGNNR